MVKIYKDTYVHSFIVPRLAFLPPILCLPPMGCTRWQTGTGVNLKAMDESQATWLNRDQTCLGPFNTVLSPTHLATNAQQELENTGCFLMNIPNHWARNLCWYHGHLLAPPLRAGLLSYPEPRKALG